MEILKHVPCNRNSTVMYILKMEQLMQKKLISAFQQLTTFPRQQTVNHIAIDTKVLLLTNC